jgi:hypothetical protein
VIVVHRRAQRLHRSAAPLMREEADDAAVAAEPRHRRTRTDPRGDLGELGPEVRAGKRRIGGQHRPPRVQIGRRQGVRAHDFYLKALRHAPCSSASDLQEG